MLHSLRLLGDARHYYSTNADLFEYSAAVQVSAKPTDADIIHSLFNIIKLSEH